MTMKKRQGMLLFFLLSVFVLSLAGCVECINTEHKDVEVTVVDEYFRAMWIQVIPCGKSAVTIVHPAEYRITVDYDGYKYTFRDSSTYFSFKNKTGQTVIGKLQSKTYDDGTVKYDIVSLKGE